MCLAQGYSECYADKYPGEEEVLCFLFAKAHVSLQAGLCFKVCVRNWCFYWLSTSVSGRFLIRIYTRPSLCSTCRCIIVPAWCR